MSLGRNPILEDNLFGTKLLEMWTQGLDLGQFCDAAVSVIMRETDAKRKFPLVTAGFGSTLWCVFYILVTSAN